MKRILINGTYAEELRIAITDGKQLANLYIEPSLTATKVGNIYKGVITKVEPSLEACFVDYGTSKQGFLSFKQIHKELFADGDDSKNADDSKNDTGLRKGQELIVQVEKDERGKGTGQKGATLTTMVSLAGNYVVLKPNSSKSGGISRNMPASAKKDVREALKELNLDSAHALIARTESAGKTVEELQWDLDFLARLWTLIEEASESAKGPFLIYKERNLIVQTLRDHLTGEIDELVVDDDEVHERTDRFIKQVMPEKSAKLVLYKDITPLFTKYQIEKQVTSAFQRKVNLPSGGYLIFDPTEALLSIDVNSGKATKGVDMDETALQTNLEAVEAIARQLRFRDHGGLIVADLIDMSNESDRNKVVNHLKEHLRIDRAKTLVGNISKFGLLEMSRQRLRSSLADMHYQPCAYCHGTGTVRNVVSSTIDLLRRIEDEANKPKVTEVLCSIPVDVATYLMNEKNPDLEQLRSKVAARIVIVPTKDLTECRLTASRKAGDSKRSDEEDLRSFEMETGADAQKPDLDGILKRKDSEKAAVDSGQVDHILSPKPTAGATEAPDKSPSGIMKFFTGLVSPFKSDESPNEEKPSSEKPKPARAKEKANQESRQGRGRSNRGGSGSGQRQQDEQGAKAQQKGRKPRPKTNGSSTSGGGRGRSKPQQTSAQKQASAPQPANQPDQKAKSAPKSTKSPDATTDKPESRRKPPARKKGPAPKGKQSAVHTGVIVSVDNIPEDIPDDIGNRR